MYLNYGREETAELADALAAVARSLISRLPPEARAAAWVEAGSAWLATPAGAELGTGTWHAAGQRLGDLLREGTG